MLLPLTYACETYLTIKERTSYIKIFEEVIISLDKLNKIYESNEITQNIEQLKNIISKFVSNKDFDPQTIISNWNEPSTMLKKFLFTD